jgi:HD-GYP domain-containing protein (c-di-GMP phosphodiesterase class II)
VFPEDEYIQVHGRLQAHVYVNGANLDGSNMKIFTLNADAAYANFTVMDKMVDFYHTGTETQLIYIEAKDLYTGPLTVSD